MTWDDVMDRLAAAGVKCTEDTYMEHYGKLLAVQRPEFHGRYFRCTYGLIHCEGVRVEVFLFPSEVHLHEFLEIIGDDSHYVFTGNAVLHFPECDPATITRIVSALRGAVRDS